MKPHRLCVALVLLAGSASIGLAQSDKHTPRLSEIMGMASRKFFADLLAVSVRRARKF